MSSPNVSAYVDDMWRVLAAACAQVGIDAADAEPIRFSENAVFRLPGQGLVARIARPSPDALVTAAKEVQVSAWLAEQGLPVVRAAAGLQQPVDIDGRAVTFWEELELTGKGAYPEIARVLRQLHALPIPVELQLPPLAPFTRLAERIEAAATLAEDDRAWLRDHLAELRQRYDAGLPPGLPHCVVHGNASIDNIVSTSDGGVMLLDLDRAAVGPPEWDLVATAVDLTTFGTLSEHDYQLFSEIYGYDVTTWGGFELLRDVRDLRNALWMAEQAVEHPNTRAEAQHRVACLRGRRGSRPWGWRAPL